MRDARGKAKPEDTPVTVKALLELIGSMEDLSKQFSGPGWESESQSYLLTRQHLSAVIQRYLDMDLSNEDIEGWANLVEFRPDILFEKGHDCEIGRVLHEIANPTLYGTLNEEKAHYFLQLLESKLI